MPGQHTERTVYPSVTSTVPASICTQQPCSRYGRWFQARAAPDLDERMLANVEKPDEDSFLLTTEDNERITAWRVVIATGLRRFAEVPEDVGMVDPVEPRPAEVGR